MDDDRIKVITEETIQNFLFSRFNVLIIGCLFVVCAYVVSLSMNTIHKLDDSVRSLDKSLILLNSSLNVIDERTGATEKELIQIQKRHEKIFKQRKCN